MFLGLSGFCFKNAGAFLDVPSRQVHRSELIATLGGDSGVRVLKAAELFNRGFAPQILLTGLEGGHSSTKSDYLHWRAQILVKQGVPEHALLFDVTAQSSWDDAVVTLKLMQSRNMKQVIVVSDPPHLRRLDWVWGKVFAGTGKEYMLVAAPMEGWDGAHWWRNEHTAQFVLMEYIKLGYYLAVH